MELESHSSSPALGTFSSRSRSSINLRLGDNVTKLTTFNPFAEEDENDHSSYTLVTSLFSRVKNTLSAPLSSTTLSSTGPTLSAGGNATTVGVDQRRPSYPAIQQTGANIKSIAGEHRHPLVPKIATAAPPLVSLTPAQSEFPSFNPELERSSSRNGLFSSASDAGDGGAFGTTIPGFPIQDDARSVRTTTSAHWPGSVSKVFRRLRGEGLSKGYWMDDDNCKECYDCKSMFTTWRRKHHCRICGQIFCSRCASNVIKGTRFGYDGLLRVCNLCLEKPAKPNDGDDDDDRQSVISSVSFPAHQYPQSPFAAAKMFDRMEGPFAMFSIAPTTYKPSEAPLHQPWLRDAGASLTVSTAPFRRRLSDDEKDSNRLITMALAVESPTVPMTKSSFTFPIVSSILSDHNTVQFPVGSPEQISNSLPPSSHIHTTIDAADAIDETPFIRSRTQSRVDGIMAQPGWRTRRESTAYAQELNIASLKHLEVMLRQMLTLEGISNVKEWEAVLSRLALRIARDLTFTNMPHHQGADMDIRRYVKIKKIPGGMPHHSEYVDGVVITKNVAHKQMSRSISNPRIALIGFPLEFYRFETQYVNFGQVLMQEKEYLRNLASRITALSPHVVLVEKTVSSLILDILSRHNVVVARTVKSSAIATVSRMTQANLVSSMDKLALGPQLGHCSKFRLQTFDHALIPGRRKTYMRFEGCSRDTGCTIILRGGNLDVLRRIKKVTRFLTFIVRNLKLETHLWKDAVISPRGFESEAIPTSMHALLQPTQHTTSISKHLESIEAREIPSLKSSLVEFDTMTSLLSDALEIDKALLAVVNNPRRLSEEIDHSLLPYSRTFISVSAALRFPPPYPIRRVKELDLELMKAKQQWDEEISRRREKTASASVVRRESLGTTSLIAFSDVNDAQTLSVQIEALPNLNLPRTPMVIDKPLSDSISDVYSPESSLQLSSISSLSSSYLEKLPTILQEADFESEGRYVVLHSDHEEQRRIWEWYIRKNKDDFIVDKYQCIYLWECTVPNVDHPRPCAQPKHTYIEFYGENDCTLGQYIEKVVGQTIKQIMDPKAICPSKGCQLHLSRHNKIYVHNEVEVSVAVEQWEGEILTKSYTEPEITTWSACRKCGCPTPFIPVSQEVLRYSFAKFLELHFYPADVRFVEGAGCEHNVFAYHIRYFAVNKMTVRFQSQFVKLYEVIHPPTRIYILPQDRLRLKNADFARLHKRNQSWYSGLTHDLRQMESEFQGAEEWKVDLPGLVARARREQEEICQLINRIYQDSAPTDILVLNEVHQCMQDNIVAWQAEFDKLPKISRISMTDLGTKRISAFDSVRSYWPLPDVINPFEMIHSQQTPVPEGEPALGGRESQDNLTLSASELSEVEVDGEKLVSSPALSSVNDLPAPSEAESDSTINAPQFFKSSFVASSEGVGGVDTGEMANRNQRERANEAAKDPGTDSSASANANTIKAPPQVRPSRLPRRTGRQTNVGELIRRFDPSTMQAAEDQIVSSPLELGDGDQETLKPQLRGELQGRPLLHTRNFSQSSRTDEDEISRRGHIRPLSKQLTGSPHTVNDALVIKYGNVLPASLIHELSKPPLHQNPIPWQAPISESEQEYASSTRKPVLRNKMRPSLIKKPSTSDFEHSYAANIAPRYLTSPRKTLTNQVRLPPTRQFAFGSRISTRHPSPEKRIPSGRRRDLALNDSASPPDVGGERSLRSFPGARSNPPLASSSYAKGVSRKPANRVQAMAKQFDRMSRESEKTSLSGRRFVVIRGRRVRPVASASAHVEVLDSVKDVVNEESEGSESSGADDERDDTLEHHKGSPDGSLPEEILQQHELPGTPEEIKSGSIDSVLPAGPLEPANPSEAASPLIPDYMDKPPIVVEPTSAHPLDAPDVHNDPVHIFRDCPVVVRTDEPTSIVALALSSPQYREMLAKSRAESRAVREAKLTEGGEAFMPDDNSVAESCSTWGVVNVDSIDTNDPTEELRTPSSKLPWAISFESGGLIISCTILYPEQFDALRRTFGCETSMIESLSRCVKWNASGGKSGCAFLKTQDDRFIAKELSRSELQSMETFGPAYFDYLSLAVSANRPTLLAKVFGCFKVSFKKKGTGRSRSTQMNLLVMENLFYNATFSKIYDLKGSTRNRHTQSTGRENEVLLDENLIESAHLNPFYLREHSKRILRGCLWNDSKFLAETNVMDYSLVCGVDADGGRLVIGIVDYVRTYTWDKKLETWVKESAFLGRTAGEPTIVTPKQYRQRFLSAMERYFPLIPDRWMKHKDTPEEDPKSVSELWPDW